MLTGKEKFTNIKTKYQLAESMKKFNNIGSNIHLSSKLHPAW